MVIYIHISSHEIININDDKDEEGDDNAASDKIDNDDMYISISINLKSHIDSILKI